MIELKEQIDTLLFSFLFGIFFALLSNFNYKFINSNHKFFKIVFTFLFVLTNILIYFICLEHINNGYLHSYFILMIIMGAITEIILKKIIAKLFRK